MRYLWIPLSLLVWAGITASARAADVDAGDRSLHEPAQLSTGPLHNRTRLPRH